MDNFPIPTPPKPEEALEEYCKLNGFRRTINFTNECHIKIVNNLGTCVEGSGKGLTREKAHHEASKNLLFKLNSEEYLSTQQNEATLIVGSSSNHTFDIEVPGDPVSELQMTYLKKSTSTSQPVYDEIKVEGPAHKRVFTISCKFDGMIEFGSASTKKSAKRIAAYNILKLRQIQVEEKKRNEIQVGNFLSSIRSEIESSSKSNKNLDKDKNHDDKSKKHKHKDKERDRDRDRDKDRERRKHRSNSAKDHDHDKLKSNENETHIIKTEDPTPTSDPCLDPSTIKNEPTTTDNLTPTESLNEAVKSDCELGEIVDSSEDDTNYQNDKGKSLIFGGVLMGKKRKHKDPTGKNHKKMK